MWVIRLVSAVCALATAEFLAELRCVPTPVPRDPSIQNLAIRPFSSQETQLHIQKQAMHQH